MKKAMIALVLALIALSAAALPKVAVLNPTLAKGIDEGTGSFIVDKILSQLIASRTFNILDRASRDVIWQERNFQLTSGEIESKQIKEIGKGLGADFIVVVKIIHIGTLYAMSAQMINVESLEVVSVASAEAPDKLENLVSLASECGAQLAGGGTKAVVSASSAPAAVTTAPKATQAPAPAAATGETTEKDLFDFTARTYKIPLGGEWVTHDDSGTGGDSYAALDPNALKNDGVIRFDYKLNQKFEYRLALVVAGFDAPKDLSKYSGIEVKWRGSGHQARIEVLSDAVKDYCWHSYLVNKTSKDWTVTKVPFKKFLQLDWGKQVPLNLRDIIGIQFITATQRVGEKGWIEIAYLKLVE
jgi:hypothetical protein